MMKHKSFACLILTHGRPNNQRTLKTLNTFGYTGKTYLVIDDEDDTADEYYKLYGDMVIQFCKEDVAKRTDQADLSHERRTILYARNAVFDIAKNLGLENFLMLDDDYDDFNYRWVDNWKLRYEYVKNIDPYFDAYLDYLNNSPLQCLCFLQNGDFIGGAENFVSKVVRRKAMNCFFCRTDRPFQFVGRINEDVNTYVTLGSRGVLFMSIVQGINIHQPSTQKNSGGMTEAYKEQGTYVKTFYSVMMAPNAVKVYVLKDPRVCHPRIHHRITWNNCEPKILRQSCRKW